MGECPVCKKGGGLSGCRMIRQSGDNELGDCVNCSDCAAFVVSFANILGCELYSSIMGVNFTTREYWAIGRQSWTPPGWGWGGAFNEVAWSGACGDLDMVFDACLKYGGDDNPIDAVLRTPMLPVAIQFSDGDPGSPFLYRERLVPSGADGYEKCESIPFRKKRRSIK